MAIKSGKFYLCGYCGERYNDMYKADRCYEQHELIFVPLSKSDLNSLLQFLYLRNEALLTKTLVATLSRYIAANRNSEPIRYEKELDPEHIV